MDTKDVLERSIIVGITLLFFGASIVPCSDGNSSQAAVDDSLREDTCCSRYGDLSLRPVCRYQNDPRYDEATLFHLSDDDAVTDPSVHHSFEPMTARGSTLYVGGSGPGNYSSIQAAINAAQDGDTVFVYDDASPYYENVTICKSIHLIGENRNTTIIDGRGQFYVAHIRSTEGAMLSGFTIRNGSYAGIKSYTNSHCLIQGNILENNEMGIQLWYSSFFIIRENMITGCSHSGIFFGDFTYNNTITQNIIRKNDVGCFFCSLITISNRIYNNTFVNNSWGICSNCHEDEPPSNWNQIYHNHFIHNEVQAYEIEDHHNYWDNGYPSGGNCWSDYTGYDLYSGPDQNILGSDGIGDTPYAIPSGDSIDQYPLMGPPGGPNAVDPHRSSVTLTNESIPGLLTCPAGDGSIYRYVKVTCRNITGASLPGIFVEEFRFIPSGCPGAPSCVFTPVDTETNETGDIRFEVETDSSIIGNISIQVKVTGIPLDDIKVLPAKSIDIVSDGTINIADFVIFGQDYGTTHWRSDFNWDGRVSLNDFVMFAQHYGHHG